MNTSMTNGSFGSSATTSSLLVQRIKYFGSSVPGGLILIMFFLMNDMMPDWLNWTGIFLTPIFIWVFEYRVLYRDIITKPARFFDYSTADIPVKQGELVHNTARNSLRLFPGFGGPQVCNSHDRLYYWVCEKKAEALLNKPIVLGRRWLFFCLNDVEEALMLDSSCLGKVVQRLEEVRYEHDQCEMAHYTLHPIYMKMSKSLARTCLLTTLRNVEYLELMQYRRAGEILHNLKHQLQKQQTDAFS